MAIRIINPAAGTSNPGAWDRSTIAIITTDQADLLGQWDFIIIDAETGIGSCDFTLPFARNFPGKKYDLYFRSTAGGVSATVLVGAGDTVAGQTSYALGAVGVAASFVSDGVTSWVPRTLNTNIALPVTAIPPATDGQIGGVIYVGTAADPDLPAVPAIEASGTIPVATLPAATTGAIGASKIIGTPVSATAPIVPVVESGGVAGTTASPVTVTTAFLVGKTMTFVNGLLVSIA